MSSPRRTQRRSSTLQVLIHGHMNDIVVKTMHSKTVTLDAAGLALVKGIAEQRWSKRVRSWSGLVGRAG